MCSINTEAVIRSCAVKMKVLKENTVSESRFEKTVGRRLMKRNLQNRCFLVNFAKFVKAPEAAFRRCFLKKL